ncbi:hypothetical protein BS50DRAFT_588269 [Corynespora cassiicola Philippines]|uniref:Uncharacterized protein n=1 Tax=Corynespora cassiicola Philippines TaxID=1448308 RepID=A0A2T2NPC1_CORCC|nr:hypothetical protein BS50DRAFT_588269 [Corynespora cassiicola Philippines]
MCLPVFQQHTCPRGLSSVCCLGTPLNAKHHSICFREAVSVSLAHPPRPMRCDSSTQANTASLDQYASIMYNKVRERTNKHWSCSHAGDMPRELRERLGNPEICPKCNFRRHVQVISGLQDGIHLRGGVYKSKIAAVKEKEKGGPGSETQMRRHHAWMRKWRTSKMDVEADLLELLDIDRLLPSLTAIWGVKDALEIWYSEQENMSMVPGCEVQNSDYVDEIMTDESPGIKDQPNDENYTLRGGLERNDSLEPDPSAHRPPLKRFKLSFRLPGKRSSQCSTRSEKKKDQNNTTAPLTATPPRALLFNMASVASVAAQVPLPPSPPQIQKASRSAAFPGKRVAFRSNVTISPSHQDGAWSLPILEHRPHSRHTRAMLTNPRFKWRRCHPDYAGDGTWSAPPGYELVDTSMCSVPWGEFDGISEIAPCEETPLQETRMMSLQGTQVESPHKTRAKSPQDTQVEPTQEIDTEKDMLGHRVVDAHRLPAVEHREYIDGPPTFTTGHTEPDPVSGAVAMTKSETSRLEPNRALQTDTKVQSSPSDDDKTDKANISPTGKDSNVRSKAPGGPGLNSSLSDQRMYDLIYYNYLLMAFIVLLLVQVVIKAFC